MKFRIHFEMADGSEDEIELEGATIEEVRDKANAELVKRRVVDAWSEELEPDAPHA